MKNTLRPSALLAALAGLAVGTAHAQTSISYPTLGDAAFVPYYTVNGDWVTGVSITNISNLTQVIKLRFRRAEDSYDVLDFNLVLSPQDAWAATLSGDETEMRFITDDKSCTAPELLDNGDGRTYAPIFDERLEGAQEGYIEVIGMAAANPAQLIAMDALHGISGVPAFCDRVRDNFFIEAVVDNDTTVIDPGDPQLNGTSIYTDTGNVLKVSYFLRDTGRGIEFGNNAVHFSDFMTTAAMTHQQFGLEAFDLERDDHGFGNDALNGWDFPDVRGGGINTDARNSIDVVRAQLGANSVVNDWSYHPGTGAATDWILTFPGQYALVDHYQWEDERSGASGAVWDYRELPASVTFNVYDREEQYGGPGSTTLPFEVNVIEWGGSSVLGSNFVTSVEPAEALISAQNGWASLKVTGNSGPQNGLLQPGDNGWCDVAAGPLTGSPTNGGDYCVMYPVDGPVPVMGFAAWERTFSAGSGQDSGHIVEHSFLIAPGC